MNVADIVVEGKVATDFTPGANNEGAAEDDVRRRIPRGTADWACSLLFGVVEQRNTGLNPRLNQQPR